MIHSCQTKKKYQNYELPGRPWLSFVSQSWLAEITKLVDVFLNIRNEGRANLALMLEEQSLPNKTLIMGRTITARDSALGPCELGKEAKVNG